LLAGGDNAYARPVGFGQPSNNWRDLDNLGTGSNNEYKATHGNGVCKMPFTLVMHSMLQSASLAAMRTPLSA
jgi:hypothetical protein